MLSIQRKYRIGPANKPIDHSSFVDFEKTVTGVGLRPYQPVHLRSNFDGGDYQLNWTRRTRTGGDNWATVDVPLGEVSEVYSVRVIAGGTVRRAETTTAPNWTYSLAQQTEDGVAAPFEVEVAQVSDLFGPGIIARIVIDG